MDRNSIVNVIVDRKHVQLKRVHTRSKCRDYTGDMLWSFFRWFYRLFGRFLRTSYLVCFSNLGSQSSNKTIAYELELTKLKYQVSL